ncbi:MAG: TetR family transcriptional regulator [Solirubrobacterales bacterium]|nr:TetR family transcriptional regulator [Solirubrobacterales bacterium]
MRRAGGRQPGRARRVPRLQPVHRAVLGRRARRAGPARGRRGRARGRGEAVPEPAHRGREPLLQRGQHQAARARARAAPPRRGAGPLDARDHRAPPRAGDRAGDPAADPLEARRAGRAGAPAAAGDRIHGGARVSAAATPTRAGPSPRRVAQRAERRGAILDATVRILTSEGLAAVTHRAVAREADVPLAATTYYFSSKDELVTEALAILVEDEFERISTRAIAMGHRLSSPSDAAAGLAEVLLPDADAARRLLAKFEVYLEAARRPGLRSTAAHWQRAFAGLAASALALAGADDPERLAPLLVAGTDGILVHELSQGITGDGDVERLRARLEQLFAVVLAAE